MSAITTYTCDRCAAKSSPGANWPSIYYDGKSTHYCDACKEEIKILLASKAETSVEAARQAAVAVAVKPLNDRIADLEERVADRYALSRALEEERDLVRQQGEEIAELGERLQAATRDNNAFKDLVTALQGDVKKAQDRARDLSAALGKERADAARLAHDLRAMTADCDAWRAVTIEVIGMLGRKARRRNAARIAEIVRIAEESDAAPHDKNDALVEARRRAQAEMKVMRDVPGPSFLERHAKDGK